MIKRAFLFLTFMSLPAMEMTTTPGRSVVTLSDHREFAKQCFIQESFRVASTVLICYIVKKILFTNEETETTNKVEPAEISQPDDTFASVAGVTEAKKELHDIVDFLKDPEKYRRLGAKIPKGVLLAGAPGNGKTLLARALAGEAECSFISCCGSEFVEMYVGVGAARVRELFERARKNAPCIIFIDEIDAIGMHRDSQAVNQEHSQTLNQLLSEMDGFNSNADSVIVLAATNQPDLLDKALLRPGRFDRKVEVPYPDLASRTAILKLHAQNILMDLSINMHKIACGTPGFSGADLANLVNEAALFAVKRDGQYVCLADFEKARDKILIGTESETMVLTEHERETTAYHEAGHALIRLLLPEHTDPLHKVTIAPRGNTLGVTYSLPEYESHSQTKQEMLATIQVLLGGRIAEELQFAEIATGASNDFRQATQIAHAMVCQYGMSDLGTTIYPDRSRYSEETSHKIDQEVRKIIAECYEKAKQLLQNNRAQLRQLAEALLEKETLEADEVYELLGFKKRATHKFE